MRVIETERLLLRRITTEDAPFILGLLNEPSFIEHIGDRGVRTLAQAAAYIEGRIVASYSRHGFGLYLVVLKDGGEAAGICGLVKRDGLDDVDLGFAFVPAYWKRGYAVESARAVMDLAGSELGLERIVAITSPANQRSMALLGKLGFVFEKMVRLTPESEDLRLFSRRLAPSSHER